MFLSAFNLYELLQANSVGLTVFVISVVAVLGLALGSLRVRGLTLGIGGVLFAGLLMGQFLQWTYEGKLPLEEHVMHFAREFGLILFVYTIGVQVGPGFVASLRKQGLPLNLMAASIVILGVIITVIISKAGGVAMKDAVGIFSGATTNTPSLAAAQQALALHDPQKIGSSEGTVAAYAIAYPFGIIGIILAMMLFRAIFRIVLKNEAGAFEAEQAAHTPRLATMTLEVTNANLKGRPIRKIPAYDDGDVVVSRLYRGGKLAVANPETCLEMGDVLLAVGPREALDDLRVVVGRESMLDLKTMPSQITTRRILVTKNQALGQTVDELDLQGRLNVSITRIRRGEVELPPSPNVPLQFGDTVMAVGEEAAIAKAAQILGDSTKRLNHPQVIPIFVGLALGVILGSIPIAVPGIPAAVKLGLAGGPLLVAIILSRLGHLGPLVWHLPQSANFALRELGIVLFLACVGIKSGSDFFKTLIQGPGLTWMMWGAVVTFIPLLIVGIFARVVMKTNYMSLCGLLAGSMTDPPALAFAGTVTNSDAPNIAYAAVYPMVMLLRVVAAQILVLFFV